ncbi:MULTISPECIES: anti-sigma regulatory factor [Virgibacillus]|uniref:Serine/threonine protein kinase n=1 Tax=Virgibacillus pantothenticus TaxID=1473 RepID=A0A0L0QT09_VIRPA|nr:MULTISPECIES: anti-sigma regulatory factor [Virgibacillus]API91643.1 ATP-binding protein [Virgibacillus sp. 6R]KNE21694.1 serine/threonine protein kinase [Virgibacillus pantothenticus]MBS7427751.1 anti-sigma regulatory factor [Virgibacillus sp. 19R1-5]MBU8568781.1 anti-sigma regulatory factor [Virgibacillus pantothenticus]MBU8602800.1 anti-sigma regulatory factor [Virgibacillus pantothenticus]
MKPQSCVNIKKEWDIVGARQLGRDIAREIGFGTVDQARIATTISELARNIYLYADHGQICFEVIDTFEQKGLCIIAIDIGPGIEDVGQVLEDGYSTSGGLGAGLPGVKRLMDEFDLQSEVGKGTRVKAIKWLR